MFCVERKGRHLLTVCLLLLLLLLLLKLAVGVVLVFSMNHRQQTSFKGLSFYFLFSVKFVVGLACVILDGHLLPMNKDPMQSL